MVPLITPSSHIDSRMHLRVLTEASDRQGHHIQLLQVNQRPDFRPPVVILFMMPDGRATYFEYENGGLAWADWHRYRHPDLSVTEARLDSQGRAQKREHIDTGLPWFLRPASRRAA